MTPSTACVRRTCGSESCNGRHFYEGATRLLGLGRVDGRQLQVAIPAALGNGNTRRTYLG